MSAQLATFTLDGHVYGVDVDRVQEVLRSQPRTRVPLAPPAVAGLVNLRGQVLTAIDLRTRLGLSERGDGVEPMVVVIRVAGEPISLLVDSIGDVVDVDPQDFEPPPDTLVDTGRDLVLGVYKLPGRLLLALDPDRAVAV
ncbi:chemotaxis protein CheW [Angustibacter sp. Root456]|uniref:chemotaxis protein CheW n=1 Tax=Angustibacter sp. Root456 TaxID=1736539 RepID=UPI0006FD404A|nr:chemotaxis protein CheW [Angustibacter sp. Root456]KQX68064.1 chemotaxis protein CheW [Angustibacter sp. Root456]